MKGCSVDVKKEHGRVTCGRNSTRIVLTHDRRIEHRCARHARAKDVKEAMTYKQWRKL